MSILETVEELDELIRLQEKVESKLRAGHIIDAWRELTRIIAVLRKERQEILAKELAKEEPEEQETDNAE